MKTNQPVLLPSSIYASQRGLGMVEVLVAMVLLAIGVLGYAAMQVRAVEATGDALTRSQAMVILRGLAENVRVMDSGDQSSYVAKVHSYAGITAPTASTTSPAAPSTNCKTTDCSAVQMADYDAYQVAITALQKGIHIDMYSCPLTAASGSGASAVAATSTDRQCMVAAWGATTPTSGTTAATDCMTQTGAYHPKATCIMLETY